MIDLFGLGKRQDPQEPREPTESSSPSEPSAGTPAPRGSHKLWAFLLVLDSVFVIVFAGAVTAKVYQHWKAPAIAPAKATRRRPPKTPPAAIPVVTPAPAPAPVPAPEPPKHAANAPRPPKPSMLTEAPKHRETPKLADAGGKSTPGPKPATPTPVAAAAGKVKALRTEFKIHAPKAKAVELIGSFIVRGGRKDMTRQEDGTWSVTLYLNPGSYRYFFFVDKKKQMDPENPLSEKGASLLAIP